MAQRAIELARDTLPTSRSVLIEFHDTGGLRVSAQDIGPATALMGSDDGELEFWVDVPKEGLQQLSAMLLKERYSGHIEAVSEFRAYCEENNIAHEFMIWS
jgi:hypothetical protein